MKTLVIAEKPSVGRDIARVLQCTRNSQGALEGEKYIVTWALRTACRSGWIPWSSPPSTRPASPWSRSGRI